MHPGKQDDCVAQSILLVILLLLSASVPASAADTIRPAAQDSTPLSEQGIVTGQLVTVQGNNFFQYFVTFWRDQPLADRYTVTVREKPSALRGSLIRIECLNQTVFEAYLPNSRGDIKAFSQRAVQIAFQNASQADVQRLLFRDADLGPDEF